MGKLRKPYTREDLHLAILAVLDGEPIANVCKRTGIPKSTLSDKVAGKVPINTHVTLLTIEEQKVIVQQMVHLSNRGFLVTKKQLINHVESFVKNLNRDNRFPNGSPDRHWCERFLHRHAEISNLITHYLPLTKAAITEEQLNAWFQAVKIHMDVVGMDKFDGSRIFNIDETAFYLRPKGYKFHTKKRDKAVNNDIKNEWVTVVFTANAVGTLAPPMVIFKYKIIPNSITESAPPDWIIGKSSTGWMTAETFFDYITNVFHPWLTNNNIQRPVVLYVDGQTFDVTYSLAQFCSENQIELVSFLPNSKHILQPLNAYLFEPLQEAWKSYWKNSWRECVTSKVQKEEFCNLLKSVMDSLDLQNIISNGFRETGLCPVLNSNEQVQNSILPEEKPNIKNDAEVAKIVLQFAEKIIDSKVLDEFKNAEKNETWTGDPRHESLFFFWLTTFRLSNLKCDLL